MYIIDIAVKIINNVLLKAGKCEIVKEEVNKVVCENEEIKMLNIRNRKKKEEVIEGVKGNKKKLEKLRKLRFGKFELR